MKLPFKRTPSRQMAPSAGAFTLVELMISMVVLSLILVVATSVMSETQKTWLRTSARTEQFRDARMAFEQITQNLRQATLNTYLTYQYNDGDTPTVPQDKTQGPQKYVRHSELQFVTGNAATILGGGSSLGLPGHCVFFQGTVGVTQRDGYENLNRLLCSRGYFIMFGNDDAYRPSHVTEQRMRFRLMEYRPPAERNEVYSVTPGLWFEDAANQIIGVDESVTRAAFTRPVTENIIALVISPRVSDAEAAETGKQAHWVAPMYAYDSTKVRGETTNNTQGTQHLLPPQLRVTLVALDEASARLVDERSPASVPDLVPANAFSNPANYEQDMLALEDSLREQKLNYRVFSTTITLRNSKWAMYGH